MGPATSRRLPCRRYILVAPAAYVLTFTIYAKQLSVYSDGGATFGVIHSFIGGCPLAPNSGDEDTLTFQVGRRLKNNRIPGTHQATC